MAVRYRVFKPSAYWSLETVVDDHGTGDDGHQSTVVGHPRQHALAFLDALAAPQVVSVCETRLSDGELVVTVYYQTAEGA